jgi:hypothetical protein
MDRRRFLLGLGAALSVPAGAMAGTATPDTRAELLASVAMPTRETWDRDRFAAAVLDVRDGGLLFIRADIDLGEDAVGWIRAAAPTS